MLISCPNGTQNFWSPSAHNTAFSQQYCTTKIQNHHSHWLHSMEVGTFFPQVKRLPLLGLSLRPSSSPFLFGLNPKLRSHAEEEMGERPAT